MLAPVQQALRQRKSIRVAPNMFCEAESFKEMPPSAHRAIFRHLMFYAAPCCFC